MGHLFVWVPISLLVALWSGLCWAAGALLSALRWADSDSVDWPAWLEQWRIPAWLADWLPMQAVTALKTWLTALLGAWGPWLADLAQQAPQLLAWLVPALWAVWLVGLLGLLLVGGVGSVLVLALREPNPKPPAGR